MSVSALERFRHLVYAHHFGSAGGDKLTKMELDSALEDLRPEDKLEAREIALDAMVNVELTEDSLQALQDLLGTEPIIPAAGGSSGGVSPSAMTSGFAVRLKEAQGEDSVGGRQIWKWEMEQALKTFGRNYSSEEVQSAVRSILDSSALTPDAAKAARMFLKDGTVESVVMMSWPEDISTAHFENLTGVIGDTVESAYDLTRANPSEDLLWSGPSTPDFAVAGGETFSERLTVESLLRSEQQYGRDPLDVIVGIGVQLGMEQGRRVTLSAPGLQLAGQQIDIIESAFANGDIALAKQALGTFISGLKQPLYDHATGALTRPNGTMEWPEGDLPVSLDELAAPLRKLLEDAYTMERRDPETDIAWLGATSPDFMSTMSYDEHLSAEGLRSAEQEHGQDALDVIITMNLEIGMEQGRRMTLNQDFGQVLQIAEMALFSIESGQPNSAMFMIPMIRQMWTL